MIEMYGFWRSAATYRVRVALNFKGVAVHEIPIDLDAGAQHDPAFLAVNPQGAVPALVEDSEVPLTQSMAILEYLEERYPEPQLLPNSLHGRARVRSLAFAIACDSHPLIVPRVRSYLTQHAGFDKQGVFAWLSHWFDAGLHTVETRLAGDGETGRFCHGDTPTFADLCLMSAVNGVRTMKLDVRPTPVIDRIAAECEALEAFQLAAPSRQIDFPAGGDGH